MHSRIGLGVILLLAGMGCSCLYREGYDKGVVEARERYLRSHLLRMREGIKKYTTDKGQPPQALEDLVNADYITHVPPDPVTDKSDWVIVKYDCSALANCKNGIKDVHSASTAKSTKGNRYSDW